MDQLTVIAEQVGVEIFKDRTTRNRLSFPRQAIEYAKANKFDVVIIDTAREANFCGRRHDARDCHESRMLYCTEETLFVVDAMTGQDAVNTAATFNERINFDGVVLTKMDGDTKGGVTLSSIHHRQADQVCRCGRKRWMHWMYSIRTGWRGEFLAWVILYPL
ncbi:MAG: hypothetical protein U0T81_13460 [Saprospiraceae bacterium]